MLNNAIDHSQGHHVTIEVERDSSDVKILMQDDGKGIFKHITKLLKLPDEREALFELSKGKLTTDPNNHTGEGIFFTSRAFDQFVIASGALNFTHQHDREWGFLLHLSKDTVGTLVWMNISLTTQRELTAVFNEFAAPNAFHFERA